MFKSKPVNVNIYIYECVYIQVYMFVNLVRLHTQKENLPFKIVNSRKEQRTGEEGNNVCFSVCAYL